ncbi:MAG TPA: alpha/beta hydrolase [Candidatus Limnocylindrales bacterium]|nr:alpha/beta hydrolase [Candidatus Limnocylindrales bacterium]
MPSEIGRAVTADGIELRTRHWRAGDPWAAMLIVHGLGEQSGRYEHVGEHFAAAGIDTFAYDHRGNGGSGGRRGDIDRWSRYHDDLEERLAAVQAAADGRPVILYAHSMGALIAAGYLLTDRPRPDLTVLTAPGLDSTLAGWKKRLAPVVAKVLPTLSVPNGVAMETLSRDPEVGRRVRADPLNGTTSTARFAAEALAEQARVRAGARRIGGPTLILHGLDDRLVPPSASEVFEGAPGVERRTYPGLRHELHNEAEGPAILDEVVVWLRQHARLPAQPNTASGERLAR